MMNNRNNTLYLLAGIAGFIAGVLYAPDKGSISRLKAKRATNQAANKLLVEIEKMQNNLEAEV